MTSAIYVMDPYRSKFWQKK